MRWPIFVISLSDAFERRQSLLSQCANLGLNVEIVDAVDGRTGLPPEFEAKIDRVAALSVMGREMTDAEFACALSHQSIYERIYREDLPGAIILEDDAILTSGFADFYNESGYLIAPFIQLDHRNARYYPWKKTSRLRSATFFPAARNASLTTAYSLTNGAARYIVSRCQPLACHADWPCDMMPLRPLVAVPRLVTQPPVSVSQSSLEAERLQSSARSSKAGRWKRFGKATYWHRWLLKRATLRIR